MKLSSYDHVTNENYYITTSAMSTTTNVARVITMPLTTKTSRVIAWVKGTPTIKSGENFIK